MSRLRALVMSVVDWVARGLKHHLGLNEQAALASRRFDALEGRLARLPVRADEHEREALRRDGLDAELLATAALRACAGCDIDPADPLHADFYWKHLSLLERCSAPVSRRLLVTSTTVSLPGTSHVFRVLPTLSGVLTGPGAPPCEADVEALPFLVERTTQMVLVDEELAAWLLLRGALLRQLLARLDDELIVQLAVEAGSLATEALGVGLQQGRMVWSDALARRRLHEAGLFEVELVSTWPRIDVPGPRRSRQDRDHRSFYRVEEPSGGTSASPAPAGVIVATYAGRKSAGGSP